MTERGQDQPPKKRGGKKPKWPAHNDYVRRTPLRPIKLPPVQFLTKKDS